MKSTSRGTVPLKIDKSQIEEAMERARNQEKIYGHNTGHFTLKVEKENTMIGVLGEIAVRDWLANFFSEKKAGYDVRLCAYGSPYDLEISKSLDKQYIHVKTGMWKSWPRDDWHFGIHADQGIPSSGYPLVLVTFLRDEGLLPTVGRLEGFIDSEKMNKAKLIRKGEAFPSTGVVSRTDNLLTTFADYESMLKLVNGLILK
jgi:hypothetical protein